MVTDLINMTTWLAVFKLGGRYIKLLRTWLFIFEVANLEHGLTVVFTSVVVCAWASPYPTEAEVAAAQ